MKRATVAVVRPSMWRKVERTPGIRSPDSDRKAPTDMEKGIAYEPPRDPPRSLPEGGPPQPIEFQDRQ